MKNIFYSRKLYFIMAIIILGFWIINSFVPVDSCHQARYYGIFHWDVCDNMNLVTNVVFVVFQVITLLGTAYLIVVGLLFLQQDFRQCGN